MQLARSARRMTMKKLMMYGMGSFYSATIEI